MLISAWNTCTCILTELRDYIYSNVVISPKRNRFSFNRLINVL